MSQTSEPIESFPHWNSSSLQYLTDSETHCFSHFNISEFKMCLLKISMVWHSLVGRFFFFSFLGNKIMVNLKFHDFVEFL